MKTSKTENNLVCKLATKIKKKNKKHTYANQSMRYKLSEDKGCIGKTGVHTKCHEFTGSLNVSGYGQTYVDGRNQSAHRVAYEHFIGNVPKDKEVGHICHNRSCINPDHLTAITHSENIKQSYEDRSNRKPGVKLTKEQQLEVFENTNLSVRELATKYNVSITTITRIRAKFK